MFSKTIDEIVVVGLGNPLLCDDTAGLLVVDAARKRLSADLSAVRFVSCFTGGFDLLDALCGASKAVLIDSIRTGVHEPGECIIMRPDEIFRTGQERFVDSHGIELPAVLELGRSCGMKLPDEIIIIGIEGTDFAQWSDTPTSAVLQGVEQAVCLVKQQIDFWIRPYTGQGTETGITAEEMA